MSRKTVIKGTLILTFTGILTKILGFANRVYLSHIIGLKELGIFQMIFPIYILAFAISSQGMSTAITKQVSYQKGKNNPSQARRTFYTSMLISFTLSIITFLAMNALAVPISHYALKNISKKLLINIISVAIPFVSVKACINAYFIAENKPIFSGISLFFEQAIRIYITYLLSTNLNKFSQNATLAVLALTIGEISATLFTLAIYLYYVNNRNKSTPTYHSKENKLTLTKTAKAILQDFLPITVNNLIFTLFTSFEAVLLPGMLSKYYHSTNISLELFGIISGIVIPFLMFPATITNSLSTMLMPVISYSKSKNDKFTLYNSLYYSILFCLTLGSTAWLIYQFLGKQIINITFQEDFAFIILKKMSFLCPLIYLSGTLSTILNGIGKITSNLLYNIISISIRIIFLFVFVPRFGLNSYILGMGTSYILSILLQYKCILKNIKKELG